MVLRENSPAPGVQRPARRQGEALRKVPGVRRRRGGGLEGRPADRRARRRGLGAAALGHARRSRRTRGFKSLANMVAIEGQDIPEHPKLKSATFARVDLAGREGGRAVPRRVGRRQAPRRDQHQDRPRPPQRRRHAQAVGQTIRIGTQEFTIVGLYETGSLVLDLTIVMDIGVARRAARPGPRRPSRRSTSSRPDSPRPTPWPSGSRRPCRACGRSGSASST